MIAFHALVGVVALTSGLLVLLRAKGTRFHRAAGWAYVASMYILCAGSLVIDATSARPFFRALGVGWGMFHVMALVSIATVTAGLVPILRRRSEHWFEGHVAFMLWSYVGLVMATNSHFMNGLYRALRPELGSQWLTWSVVIVLGWVLPFAVGTALIPRATLRYSKSFARPPGAAAAAPSSAT